MTTLRPLNISVDEEELSVDVDAGVKVSTSEKFSIAEAPEEDLNVANPGCQSNGVSMPGRNSVPGHLAIQSWKSLSAIYGLRWHAMM